MNTLDNFLKVCESCHSEADLDVILRAPATKLGGQEARLVRQVFWRKDLCIDSSLGLFAVGDNCKLGEDIQIFPSSSWRIGDDCKLGEDIQIFPSSSWRIGDNCPTGGPAALEEGRSE